MGRVFGTNLKDNTIITNMIKQLREKKRKQKGGQNVTLSDLENLR